MTALVIGIGSAGGGDDAVGLVVAEQLRAQDLPELTVLHTGAPVSLLELWTEHDDVVLVDAVRDHAPPGTVTTRRLGLEAMPVRPGARGTHGLGVAEVANLARVLDRLPRSLTLVGVEAGSFAQGDALSSEVQAALRVAAAAALAAHGLRLEGPGRP